jgi:DNA repair protein RecO (recombination protein O)
MKNINDTVIVLRSIDYKESDKILTVYGKNFGKFAILAKGVRKLESKNRGHIQTLSIAKVSTIQVHNLPILKEASYTYIPNYTNKDIKNIERLLFIVNKFIPEQEKDTEIFSALEKTFKTGFILEYVNRFRILFLIKQGYLSGSSNCSECNDKAKYFDLKTFNMLCDTHVGNIDRNMIKLDDKDIYSRLDFTLAIDRYVSKLLDAI